MLSTMMNTGMSRVVPKAKRRVMIVSASDKIFDFAADLLPPGEFVFEEPARSAGEAKRTLIQARVDILIINTPLPDDFGTELATELSDSTMGILLLVKKRSCRLDGVQGRGFRRPDARQAVRQAELLSGGEAAVGDEREA